LGGSVRTTASVALAGRDDGPGRAITAADNIPLNDCLLRPMIFGSGGIKFARDFRPTRTVSADDAIHAQSAGRKIRTLQGEGVERDRSIFMKFDHPVLHPKRCHGIEVWWPRIRSCCGLDPDYFATGAAPSRKNMTSSICT
jgi:hypothetical protein